MESKEGEWSLILLNHWQLNRWGEPTPVGPRQQRLIALLALFGPSKRAICANMLWPTSSEESASRNLRASLFKLNHSQPGLIRSWGDTIALAATVWVDVDVMRASLAEAAAGHPAAEDGQILGNRNALLPGWYDDWVIFEQERLSQQRILALETIARTSLAAGDQQRAEQAASAALTLEPLRETACVLLVRTLLTAGNRALAIQTFERFRRVLAEELGIQPSQELAQLVGHRSTPANPNTQPRHQTAGRRSVVPPGPDSRPAADLRRQPGREPKRD